MIRTTEGKGRLKAQKNATGSRMFGVGAGILKGVLRLESAGLTPAEVVSYRILAEGPFCQGEPHKQARASKSEKQGRGLVQEKGV